MVCVYVECAGTTAYLATVPRSELPDRYLYRGNQMISTPEPVSEFEQAVRDKLEAAFTKVVQVHDDGTQTMTAPIGRINAVIPAITKAHKAAVIEVLERLKRRSTHKWWHEMSCPAHSINMRPESECNCLYGFARDDIDTTITKLKTEIEQ